MATACRRPISRSGHADTDEFHAVTDERRFTEQVVLCVHIRTMSDHINLEQEIP